MKTKIKAKWRKKWRLDNYNVYFDKACKALVQ